MASTGGIPGRALALLLPRQLGHLNALTDGPVRPFVFAGPAEAARGREEATRAELRRELASGSLGREVLSLEPLLAEFDGVALAAAALRLLDRQRSAATPPPATVTDRPVVRPPAESRPAAPSDRPFARPSSGGHGPPRSGGPSGGRGGYGSGGSRGGSAGSSPRGDSRDSRDSRDNRDARGGRGGPPGRGRPGAPRDGGGGRRPGGESGGGRGGDRPRGRADTRPLPRSPR